MKSNPIDKTPPPPADLPARYLVRVLELARQAQPGTVSEIIVKHGDTCAHWRGRPCDCEPEVSLQ